MIVTERSQGALFGFGIHQSGELETIRIAPESIEEPLPSGSNDFGETSATYEREITIDDRDQATIQFLLKTTVSRANGSATIELVGENGRTITVASAGDSTDDNNSLRTPGGFIRDQDGGGDAGTPQGRYVTVDADVSALTGQTVTVRLRTEGNASLRLRGIQLKYALPNRDTDDDGLIDRLERDGVDHGVTCSWEDGCGTGRTTSTSPYSTDTDGDGLGDWQEVGDFVSETFTVEMTPGDSDTGSRVIGDDNSTVRTFTVRYFKLQSNPTVVDSDGDGLNDRVEVTSNWAVNYTATPSATEAVIEARKNNNSGLRYFVNRTGSSDPMDPDTDRDDIGDSREVLLGTNPSDDDTDGDSIRDAEEFEQNQDPTLHDASSPNVEILGIDTTTYSTTNVRYRVTFRVTDDSGVDTVSVSRGRYGEEVEVDGDSSTGARTISFTDRSSEATETIEAYTLGPSVLVQTADVHGNSHARRYRGPNSIAQLAAEFGPGNGGYAEKGRIEFIAIVSGLAYSIAKQSQKTYEGALELLTTTYDVVTNPKQTLVRAVETIRSLTLDVDISVEKIKRFIEAQRQSLVSAQRTQNPFDANPEAGFRSNNRTFATGWYSGYAVGIGLSMILGEVAITRAVTVLAQHSSKVATLVRWKRQTEEYLFGVASDQIGKVSALTTRATKRVGSSAARAVYERLPASTQGKVFRRVESGDSELSDAVLSIASREDQSGELLEYVAKGDTGSVRTLEALRDAESPESIRTLLDLDTGTQRQLVREYTQGDLSRDELQDALDQLQRFPDNERSRIQTLLRQTGSDGTRLVAQAESETIQDLAPGGSVSLGRGADEDIAAFRRVISQSVDSTGPDAPASYAQLRETLDTLEQIQPGLQSSARRLIRQGREPAMEFIADTDASVLRQLLASDDLTIDELSIATRRYGELNVNARTQFSNQLGTLDRESRLALVKFTHRIDDRGFRQLATSKDFDDISSVATKIEELNGPARDFYYELVEDGSSNGFKFVNQYSAEQLKELQTAVESGVVSKARMQSFIRDVRDDKLRSFKGLIDSTPATIRDLPELVGGANRDAVKLVNNLAPRKVGPLLELDQSEISTLTNAVYRQKLDGINDVVSVGITPEDILQLENKAPDFDFDTVQVIAESPSRNPLYLSEDRWDHIDGRHIDGSERNQNADFTTFFPTGQSVVRDGKEVLLPTPQSGPLTDIEIRRTIRYTIEQGGGDANVGINRFGINKMRVGITSNRIKTAYPINGPNIRRWDPNANDGSGEWQKWENGNWRTWNPPRNQINQHWKNQFIKTTVGTSN